MADAIRNMLAAIEVSHLAVGLFCTLAGLILAFNRAFLEKGYLNTLFSAPLIQPFLSWMKGEVHLQDLKGIDWAALFMPLLGATCLTLFSFLFFFNLLAAIAAGLKSGPSSWFDKFADFWRGGYKAIDDRFGTLQLENDKQRREIIVTHQAYRSIAE